MSAFEFKKYLGLGQDGSSASNEDMDLEALEEVVASSGDGQGRDDAYEEPPVLQVNADTSDEEQDWDGDAVYEQLTSLFDGSEPAPENSEEHGGDHRTAEEQPPQENQAQDDEADSGSRLNWLVDFVMENDGASEDTSEPARAEEDAGDRSAEVSDADARESDKPAGDLDVSGQDKVVIALLRRGVIEMEQVAQAIKRRKEAFAEAGEDAERPPLWRILTGVEGVDRDAVFEEAARFHGYEAADITKEKPTTVFLQTVFNVFPPPVRRQLLELHLLPYKFSMDEEEVQQCLLIAVHDPLHPSVQQFVDDFALDIELRYAPESIVKRRVEAVRDVSRAESAQDEADGPRDDQGTSEESASGAPEVEAEQAPPQKDASKAPTAFKEPDDVETISFEEAEPSSLALTSPDETDAPIEEMDEGEPLVAELMDDDGPELEPQAETEGPVLEADQAQVQEEDASSSNANVDLDMNVQVENNITMPPSEEAEESAVDESEEVEEEAALDEDVSASEADEEEASTPEDEVISSDDASEEEEAPSAELQEIIAQDRVVAMLIREDIVSSDQVLKVKAQKDKTGSEEAVWRLLTQRGDVDREAVFAAAARLYGFAEADLEENPADPGFAQKVVERFDESQQDRMLELRVMPYESSVDKQTGAVRLAFITHDPTRPEVHQVMHKLDVERFELRYAPESVLSELIAEAFPKKNEYLERMEDGAEAMDLGLSHDDDGQLVDEEALEAEMSRSKLINLFEATLVEGVREGASDIHIYPNADKKVEIHFRVDGRLQHWHTEDKVHPESLLAVIKDNAMNVDRFERDAAQDGFIQRKIDNALIRFRVSVLPIANASQEIRSESIVIRILDDRKVMTDLTKLGLLDTALERFSKAINQPHGMVILTGPTGSGKSTTLVAALHQVVTPEVNVLTVEDPVEYIIDGVRQIKLNHKLTLDGALRSILRHDPDIVMVGEMRDRHTAELAIKLANTGHLTFSTLHTNDAPSAVSRLYKMGIEPFLIAYAINLVVAQRLIRRLCPTCKQIDQDPDPVLLKQLGFTEEDIATTEFFCANDDPSCPTCKGTGYKGRRAISEALYFSRNIRHMIVEAEEMIDEGAVRDQAIQEGMLTLQQSAREVVKLGDTSVREMIRVVASD